MNLENYTFMFLYLVHKCIPELLLNCFAQTQRDVGNPKQFYQRMFDYFYYCMPRYVQLKCSIINYASKEGLGDATNPHTQARAFATCTHKIGRLIKSVFHTHFRLLHNVKRNKYTFTRLAVVAQLPPLWC